MRQIFRRVAILCLVLFTGVAHALPKDSLTIETASGGKHQFDVEIAVSAAEQARGLMHRESLPADAGMLFLYDRPTDLSFWMMNTLIPLDLLFIDQGGRILNIITGKPHDLTPLRSKGKGTAVLEINGGLAGKLGIRPGDRVIHSHFDAR